MGKSEYAIYDNKDNGILIGIFDVKEVMKVFNTSRGVVYSYVSRGQTFQGRYSIVRINSSDTSD